MNQRTCSVDGCVVPFKRSHGGLDYCYGHYMRAWRYGDPASRITPAKPRFNPAGYRMVPAPGHPLGHNGGVLEHRAVMFDAIGYGPHLCHWCSAPINWGQVITTRLVVDHLDEVKDNNDRANLVESCHPCNIKRNRDMAGNGGRLKTREW